MLNEAVQLAHASARSLGRAVQMLLVSGVIFVGLALLLKGREALTAARRAAGELRLNIAFHLFDALFIAGPVTLAVQLLQAGVARYSLSVIDPQVWAGLGTPVTVAVMIFVGDLAGYWRHRLEHTRWLWPTHAIHHSDTQMTWLTLARFHPIGRLLTNVADLGCLTLLGFPDWAIIVHVGVRHYYGEFIHADLPWMYGPLGTVFVSPVMHRWHHARDVVGAGSNFATVFALFDRAFGTYYVPGPCTVPLGVIDDVGTTLGRQLWHPFEAWMARWRRPKAEAGGG